MRLEPTEPKSESDFYQGLRARVGSDYYFERVEPSNECGFPDVYYVDRNYEYEGTIELKFDERRQPDIGSQLRGNQKAALLDYAGAGGRRRFALSYCNGLVFLWDTPAFKKAILGDKKAWIAERRWNIQGEKPYELSSWLSNNGLGRKNDH